MPYLDALRYFALALSGKVALALRKKWCACARAQTQKIMRSLCARDFFRNFLPEDNFFNFEKCITMKRKCVSKNIIL